MKTFAVNKKQSAPARRKMHPYVHHPLESAQQAQQVAMRKILRPDEVQAKQDDPKTDNEYEQDTSHVAGDLSVPVITGISPGPPGGSAPPLQKSVNEEPEEELQRQPEEEEPIQAKLIQRKMADMSGIHPSRFGYPWSKQKAQQAEIHRILHSTGAQAKLTIGQPNDKYEQEADRVADQVMAMPDPKLQRQPENEEEEEMVQAKPLADQITPLVQRQEETPEKEEETIQAKAIQNQAPDIQLKCPECEKEQSLQCQPEEERDELQAREVSGQTPQVGFGVESRINSLKGGGKPLDPGTRGFFEPRFGHNFSHVRVHSDSAAADTTKLINARAFTLGNHVVMGAGEYQPNSRSGQRLLGHELTHVVQQNGGPTHYSAGKNAENKIPDSQGSGITSLMLPLSIQRQISGDYTIDELRNYLQELNQTGQINGTNSGDNMARDVVTAWLEDLTFSLTPRLKILLIRELQDGRVGNDDERAILALLQHSYNDELPTLFGPGGIDVDDLDSDMQDDEQDELDAFYESRFQGGKEAVRRGEIQPQGRQEPLWPASREGWNRVRIQDCMHQTSGVLPGRSSVLTLMGQTYLVHQHFTREELAELEQLIRANRQARRFVCTNGLTGLLAVSDTLSGTRIDIEAARRRLESGEISDEINRPFLRRQRQSRRTAEGVTEWARVGSRPSIVPSMASIVGLPAEQQAALERALQLLQRNSADTGRVTGAFQQAVAAAANIPRMIQEVRDSEFWRRSRRFPHREANAAALAAGAVVTALREANRYLEVTDLFERARSLQTSLEELPRNYLGELSGEQRYEARDQLRTLKENARELYRQIRERAQRVPSSESFERVRYLIRYFLAMNDPDRVDTSTTEQRQEFFASVANFNDDLQAVFGTGAMAIRSPVELLEVLGHRLGAQMSVRNQMTQRLDQDPGAVPGMGNVREYFQSLRGQPLATIEQAYERYASAYFEHRGLNNPADLAVDEFSDLFNRPVGIGGTRRLVCSGFARLGAQLMVDAGAVLTLYRIRFHFTPAEVAAQNFTDGHAVARLSLGGTRIWVSNQSIFHSLEQAMDVAWANPDAPSTDGTGLTLEAATNNLNFPN